MSINWEWKDKMGTVTTERGYTSNLYRGNCLCIAINEWTNKEGVEQYSLAWFFADKTHAKNCLGLSKGYEENNVNDYHFEEFVLNTKYKETAVLVDLLIKANWNGKITFYTEEKK